MSGRFLFVTWDGSGNLPPALALARTLSERGHAVRFLAHAGQAERIGFPTTAYRRVPDLYERRPLPADDVWWNDLFLAEEAGHELAAELERQPADALVVDCLLWGALAAAERGGVPACVLVHSVYGRRFAAEDLPRRRERLDSTRRALGLDADASLLAAWERAALVVVASARSFDRPDEPPAGNVVYAGPLRTPDESPPDLPWQPDVVVSFSTARFDLPRLTQRVLDALAPLPLRCAVTSRVWGLSPGANTRVRGWLPHDAVLPGASLAVTHGGHGTVMAALRHGVPVLCLPLVADQPFVARCAVEAGAGLSLEPSAPPQAIRAAVEAILAEPRFRGAARALSAEIARELEAQAHLPALERLIA